MDGKPEGDGTDWLAGGGRYRVRLFSRAAYLAMSPGERAAVGEAQEDPCGLIVTMKLVGPAEPPGPG